MCSHPRSSTQVNVQKRVSTCPTMSCRCSCPSTDYDIISIYYLQVQEWFGFLISTVLKRLLCSSHPKVFVDESGWLDEISSAHVFNINFGLIMSLGMLGESSGVVLIRLVISGDRSILLLVNSHRKCMLRLFLEMKGSFIFALQKQCVNVRDSWRENAAGFT